MAPSARNPRRRARSAGMVTAELAVALPAVVLVLALCLGGISLGIDQIRCVDAARLGARALARGETSAVVRDLAGRAGPSGAVVAVSAGGPEVRVEVSVRRQVWGLGPGFAVGATSLAQPEQQQ